MITKMDMFSKNHYNNLGALFSDFFEAELDDNLLGGESLHKDSKYKTIDSENTFEGDIDLLEMQFKHLTAKGGAGIQSTFLCLNVF